MAKHNKTINHLMIALAALQDGDVEEAQEALTDAVSQDDFDDALEVLDEVQESTFDEEASDEEETEEPDFAEEEIADALAEEEGVEVETTAGALTITMAGVRNARRAVRVIKSLASVEDAEEVEEDEVPEEIEGEFAHVIRASIEGEDVLIGVNDDGSAEVMAIEEEDEDVEAGGKKPGSGDKKAPKPGGSRKGGSHGYGFTHPSARSGGAKGGKSHASTDEDFDSWDEEETEEDEEENLAPTASVRRSRQAARRRATVAGLNFDIIARNKRSV